MTASHPVIDLLLLSYIRDAYILLSDHIQFQSNFNHSVISKSLKAKITHNSFRIIFQFHIPDSILYSLIRIRHDQSHVSPAEENPGKVRGSATMDGSSSPRCSALNMAFHSTSIRPAASLSAEAGFITSTARIRKNRQGNQGLTRRSLPFDYCLALLAAALSSSHFRSLEDRWESLKAEAYLQTDILKIDIVPQCCIFIGLVQRKKSFAPYPLNVSSVPSGTI